MRSHLTYFLVYGGMVVTMLLRTGHLLRCKLVVRYLEVVVLPFRSGLYLGHAILDPLVLGLLTSFFFKIKLSDMCHDLSKGDSYMFMLLLGSLRPLQLSYSHS